MPSDWEKRKYSPLNHSEIKPKSIVACLHTEQCFMSVTCICFEFWLVYWILLDFVIGWNDYFAIGFTTLNCKLFYSLFYLQEEEMQDPELDYKLRRTCRKMIRVSREPSSTRASYESWSTVNRQAANSWLTVEKQSTYRPSTVSWQMTDRFFWNAVLYNYGLFNVQSKSESSSSLSLSSEPVSNPPHCFTKYSWTANNLTIFFPVFSSFVMM